jgi:uncharacterized protein (TIGR03437 family)
MLKILSAMPLLALALNDPTPELIKGLSAMNSASLAAEGLPYSGVAPGARFVVYGRALGPAEAIKQETAEATSLAGVSVRVTSGGSTVDAWVMSVSEKRIEALLPLHAEHGEGTVAVNVNGTELSTSIRVVDRAFGIADSRVKVGAPGELAQVRGTGLGREQTPVGVEVLLAGNVIPAGGASRFASGWEMLSFDVPTGVEGCDIPMAIRTGTVISNFATLAVGECPEEEPSTEPQRIGSVQLSRSDASLSDFGMRIDSGSASFYRYAPIADGSTGQAGPFTAVAVGACKIIYAIEQDLPTPEMTGLDAGKLEVNGTGGVRELERQSKGSYSTMLGQQMDIMPPIPGFPGGELYFSPGEYTVTGSGGADVGAFSTRINVWDDVKWTNRGDMDTVNRASDLRIEWMNGTEQQMVTVMGMSLASQRPSVAAVFTCTERGDKGSLTVPAAILSALPATPADDEDTSILTFGVSAIKAVEFQAEGLDRGTADYTQSIMRTTKFQ